MIKQYCEVAPAHLIESCKVRRRQYVSNCTADCKIGVGYIFTQKVPVSGAFGLAFGSMHVGDGWRKVEPLDGKVFEIKIFDIYRLPDKEERNEFQTDVYFSRINNGILKLVQSKIVNDRSECEKEVEIMAKEIFTPLGKGAPELSRSTYFTSYRKRNGNTEISISCNANSVFDPGEIFILKKVYTDMRRYYNEIDYNRVKRKQGNSQ